jgi:phosphate starvation-inducible PhoH-like protein
VAVGVEFLLQHRVKRLILSRPAVEAGERLGFLPGDLREKIDPYLQPLYDALHDMLPSDHIQRLMEMGTIEIAPLAFMRGRTLSDAFIILDEAQNSTVSQMKMFLTRLGQNSKMVVTGDLSQIDLPSLADSGLPHVRRILQDVQAVEFVTFSRDDIMRHPVVAAILEAYDKDAEERMNKGGF